MITEKRTDEEPKIVAIYSRVSSGKQVFGYSLDEQIELAVERCKAMGWKIRYIFREDGESAGTIDRPKFQIMMEKARQQRFNVLIFWKLDRFCRSLMDVVNVEKELRGYNISLISLTEQIDTTTSFGRFNFRSVASCAEWELDMHKERCQMGMKALAKQEKWPNRIVPFGYKKARNCRLKIFPYEAEIVKQIFKRYVALRSMPDIAFQLNRRGIKTKRGNKWTKLSVKRILDNPLYTGNYKVSDVKKYVKDYKIISEKLYNKAKALRNRYRQDTKPMPKNRKEAVVNRLFDEYLTYLKEDHEEPFAVDMNLH
jgi:site-specific DNA recombinase